MKDLKIKGGSFDMAGAAGVAGVAIGMLGSAIGKATRLPLLKKRKKGFDEQYFRCWWYRGFRDYHNAWN
jgi:hypothetical protein